MTPFRQETSLPNTQPVGFYKIVALTFLILTVVLLGVIVFMSSKKATITVTTKNDPLETDFILGVNSSDETNNIQGQIVTTTLEIEKSFKPTGVKEEKGLAVGKMLLHNETDADQILVATTRLLTADGVLFRIKNRVNVPAKGTVETDVYADKEGDIGGDGTGRLTIPGLSEDKQKVIYATNDKKISAIRLIGVLSPEDIKKAEEQMTASLADEAIKKLSQSNDGYKVAVKILDQKLGTEAKVGDNVEEFVMKASVVVVGVLYKQTEVDEIAKKELNKKIMDDFDVLNSTEEAASVSLDEYLPEKNSATLKVHFAGIVSLNPESKQLDKSLFFGKSESEVRRYLLSLDHIKEVDIKFSPAWSRKVPSLSEHVSLVIKTTE